MRETLRGLGYFVGIFFGDSEDQDALVEGMRYFDSIAEEEGMECFDDGKDGDEKNMLSSLDDGWLLKYRELRQAWQNNIELISIILITYLRIILSRTMR